MKIILLFYSLTFSRIIRAGASDSVYIRIYTTLIKGQHIQFTSQADQPKGKIWITENGHGKFDAKIFTPTFVRISTLESNEICIIYLEPGDKLNIIYEEGIVKYKGERAMVNTCLYNQKKELRNLQDSINVLAEGELNLEVINKTCEAYFIENLSRIKTGTCSLLDPKYQYLLRQTMLSSIGRLREMYLMNYDQKEVARHLLTNNWKYDNELLSDTMLLKYSFPAQYAYVLFYHDNRTPIYILDSLKLDRLGSLYWYLDLIEKQNVYNNAVKEILILDRLNVWLNICGPQTYADSLAGILRMKKVISMAGWNKYIARVSEYDHLRAGKIGPPLFGITKEGILKGIDEFKGKVIFIDLWATWCGPCVESLPLIDTLCINYRNNSNIVFIFLSIDRDTSVWKKFIEKNKLHCGLQLLVRQTERENLKSWKIIGIPRFILINKEGEIVDAFMAEVKEGRLTTLIEGLIKD